MPEADDGPTFFVGRGPELAFLRRAEGDARAGRAVTVVLEGDSGVGKSALAMELAARCRAEIPGLLVLVGRCFERETVPYKAIDEVVLALTERIAALEPALRARLLPTDLPALRDLFPVVARLAQEDRASVAATAAPFEQRKRAAAALREWLTRVAATFPVLLILEDLHWANADTLQLLGDVMRAPAAPALLLLVTQRPQGAARSALEGEVRWLPVGNLAAEDASTLIERLLAFKGTEANAQRVAKIAAEAEGHPLFIHELIRRGSRRSLPVAATARLDEVLWKRILRLDEGCREVLQLVALAGVPLLRRVVAEALATPNDTLSKAIEQLRSASFVRTTGPHLEDTVEPYHDRVRETVVGHLTPAELRRIHGTLAETLTRLGFAPAELRAVHWAGAGNAERAGEATLEAADAANAALAFDHAAELYRRALERGGSSLEARATEIQGRLADALRNAGRGPEAASAYERAALDAPRERALFLRQRAAEQLLTSGHFDAGRRALRGVLEAENVQIAWSPFAAIFWGIVHRAMLLLRGLRFTTRAQVSHTKLREMDLLWDALRGLAIIDAPLLFDLTARLLLLALRTGDPHRLANYLYGEAMSQASWGTARSMARARTLCVKAAEVLPVDANKHTLGLQRASEAFISFYRGRWREAVELFVEAEVLFREHGTGVAWEMAVAHQFGLIALFRNGQLRRLRATAAGVLRDGKRRGDLFAMSSAVLGYPNLLHLLDDDVETARSECRDVIRRWSQEAFLYQHYHAWVSEMHADLYEGDVRAAWARVKSGWPRLRRAFLLVFPEIAHEAWHLRARAAIAVLQAGATGDLRRSALAIAKQDAARLARRGLPWPRANAAMIQGALAMQDGREGEARAHLERAIDSYREADMPLYVAMAERRLGEVLGGDAGKELRARSDELLASEGIARPDRVAKMLAPGFSDPRREAQAEGSLLAPSGAKG